MRYDDMRKHFVIGEAVECRSVKASGKRKGVICAVTQYIAVVQFEHFREAFTYHDMSGEVRNIKHV